MRRIVFFISFAMVFAALGTTAGLAGPWGRGMGPMTFDSPYYETSLDLTPEQTQKLRALRQTYLDEIAPLQNSLFSKRAELRLVWSEPNPNPELIASKQKEIRELERRIEERSIKYRLDFREVLTQEQREKAAKLESGRRRPPGSRHGRMWQQ